VSGRRKRLWLLLAAFILAAGQIGFAAPQVAKAEGTAVILYVKAIGGDDDNDGRSWSNAFATLQKALDAAQPGPGETVEIRVAAGTYYPADENGFRMKNGVAIYGGFPADATDGTGMEDRDWENHRTILSGDLNKNESFDGDDAYHVIFNDDVDDTAVLDGFVVTGGYATGDQAYGAGIYNIDSHPIIRNVRIEHNWAQLGGGGMYNENSNPTLEYVTITNNLVLIGDGGGMYNKNSSPSLTNVTIEANEAVTGNGGGMYNTNSSPSLYQVFIKNNTARNGGGMYNGSGSKPEVVWTEIRGNAANGATQWEGDGGGMYNDGTSPEIRYSKIWGNSATRYGGGMYNRSSSRPIMRNTLVVNNYAKDKGAGIYNNESYPELINVTVSRNRYDKDERYGAYGTRGAGIYNAGGGGVILKNTLVAWNGSDSSSRHQHGDNIYPGKQLEQNPDPETIQSFNSFYPKFRKPIVSVKSRDVSA